VKLAPPVNENYAATIVRVRSTVALPKCDNVVGVPIHGYQAIVSKDIEVDELRVLFTAETQLSLAYAFHNNLHRHEHLNADPSAKGYLEDNRRVKALRFRGNASNALLMPLSSLTYTGANLDELREGDTFDQLNGHDICQKYMVPTRGSAYTAPSGLPRSPRVDDVHFPKHFDTANYFRNADQFDGGREVVVTQKLHGTSVRFGHTVVRRKLTWKDRIAQLFGVAVQMREYDYVYGSRNVLKDPDDPFADPGFYPLDIYSQVGKRFKGSIPQGYLVYGEIIGWVGDTQIQPGFTYQLPRGESRLYVYRVVHVNPTGRAVDLTWDQVKAFCQEIGADHVPELSRGTWFTESMAKTYLDVRLADTHWPPGVALPTDGTVDEGICIRQETGGTPLVLKAKSPKFLELESKQLDTGEADLESVA
jgi:hypothetical protein